MTATLRIRLWIIWFALTLIAVGQSIYTELFSISVGSELLARYAEIDAQLPAAAKFAKYIFSFCESLAFVIIVYTAARLIIKDLALRAAYALYLFLTLANFFDALSGNYWTFQYKNIDFGYAAAGIIVTIIEYHRHRGKHT